MPKVDFRATMVAAAACVAFACGSNGGASPSGGDSGTAGTGGIGGSPGLTSDGGLILDPSDAGDSPDVPGEPASCPFPISAAEYATNVSMLGSQLDTLVTKFEHDYDATASGTIECPAAGSNASSEATAKWGTYAFAKLARGTDANGLTLAEAAVSCMFTYQDTKTTSPTYGVFRFHVDDAPVASDNSTEFALEPIGWLLIENLLPAATVTKIAPDVIAGLDAIDAHEVCPTYTNICLMQQAIRLSIGTAFAASSNASLASDGRTRIAKAKSELDAWAASVKLGGVREFDSPTYGEIDLEALLLGHEGAERAGDPEILARVDGAIDYLWTDFSANVFASRGTLSPPYGRTYDFAGGQGVTSFALWLEGLTGPPWVGDVADPTMASWLYSTKPGAHRPPGGALCASTPATREVVSEWQQTGQMLRGRYAYLTGDYSLGSATADFPVNGNIDIDLLVGGSLVSTPLTPLLSVLPDWLDAPVAPIAAGNFDKVTHLPLDPGVVQKDGAMLLLTRVPAANPDYQGANGGTLPLVNLTTNLIAPAKVDAVLVDGTAIDPTKSGVASARPILVVENQSGVMAMAVIDASGLDCVNSSGSITETGAAHTVVEPLPVAMEDPAFRLAIRHLDSPPSNTSTLAPCFARVALLMVARHCDGTGCAASLYSDVHAAVAAAINTFDTSTGSWSVTVQAPSGPMLHVARGMSTAGDITATQVDGVTPSFVPLSVNGTTIPLVP